MNSPGHRPQRAWPDRWHLHRLRRELAKFGTVGALAYVVDVGTFNFLRFSEFSPLTHKPITDKVLSSLIATLFAYVGNRYWAFAAREARSHRESLPLFLLINVVGMGMASLTLGFSHYVLGLTSAAADNVSANIVGTGFGTLFRFWAYRRFVFREVTAA